MDLVENPTCIQTTYNEHNIHDRTSLHGGELSYQLYSLGRGRTTQTLTSLFTITFLVFSLLLYASLFLTRVMIYSAPTFLSLVACTWHYRLSRALRLRTFSITSTCSDLAVAGTQSTDAQWQAHRASACTTNHMGVRRHLWFQRHDTTAHIWGACGHLTSSPSPRQDFSDGGQELGA